MRGFSHHFERQDGTPFLFWGDTAWALFQDEASEKLDRQAVLHYIDERARQGVNVVHSMLLQEAGWGNCNGDPFHDIVNETLNPAYWQEIDLRLRYLNDQGIIGGLVLAWGDKRKQEPFAWRLFPGVEARKRYARYIAARYGAYDVYFLISGEWHAEIRTRGSTTEEAVRREFIEIGNALEEADAHNRMIGIHPMTAHGSVREYNQADWMSFADYQQNYRTLHARILESRSFDGPIVNSEYGYLLRDSDYDGIVDKNNSFSVDDIRQATWDIIMAGGYPVTGYASTYMGGYRDKGPFNVDDPRNDPWEQQYDLARQFLAGLDWWKLEPHDEWIRSATPRSADRQVVTKGRTRRTLCGAPKTAYWLLAEPGRHYVAYARGLTTEVIIELGSRGKGVYQARLFDPRTGRITKLPIGSKSIERFTFTPPDANDWIVHMARATAPADEAK